MKKWLVLLLVVLLAMPLAAGCGKKESQREGQKPLVIKPTGPVVENIEEEPETVETEEVPSEEEASIDTTTVGGSAAAKMQAIHRSQAKYQAAEGAKVEAPEHLETLVLADFDSGEKPSNVGGNFGAWNKDPSDPTQWCKEAFDNVARHGDSGFSMKLDYSVDSPNPAYNGFWMMLPNLDASKYDTVNLWVKGDLKAGYTTVFKIELKNANKQVGRYYVSNVSDQWQKVSIPLSEFKGLIDRSNLTEFVIVFEDRMASNKKGVIYVDDISFTKTK